MNIFKNEVLMDVTLQLIHFGHCINTVRFVFFATYVLFLLLNVRGLQCKNDFSEIAQYLLLNGLQQRC